MLRFVHAADVHLDSPLVGLGTLDPVTARRLRGVTREALVALVDQALAHEVAFVVFAGDLFDGPWKDVGTALFFHQQVARLTHARIHVVVLHGNHDAASDLRRLPTHPLIHSFASRRPETVALEKHNVALHGQSFARPDVTENLADRYPPPVPGAVNVGVLHTALEGNARHARYAPCSLAQLRAHGYDYWALGHVHEHATLSTAPHVVYPGNLQGRHIHEPGAKGAVLVSIDDGACSVERWEVDVLRWETAVVDVTAADAVDDVAQLARPVLEALLAATPPGKDLALRVRIVGATGLHGALWGEEPRLREQLQVLAAQISPRVHLEKVRNDTTPPPAPGSDGGDETVLDDLRHYFVTAAADPDFRALMSESLEEFVQRCPNEVREGVAAVKAYREGHFDQLLAGVIPGLEARVREKD